ncbi:MAG: hypothetical protein SW833_17915 [Cyanobacteriota bacterium]|nr:hypothetical protein [Cyanobacteriota bacterium]
MTQNLLATPQLQIVAESKSVRQRREMRSANSTISSVGFCFFSS